MAKLRVLTRSLSNKSLNNDQGIALPMVLVVFVVGFALVGAFLVSIVGSTQVSHNTRSGIQAQAAAEAGIAAAYSGLHANPCAVPVSLLAGSTGAGATAATYSTTQPQYGNGSNWGGACNNSTQVRIVSTGVAGDTSAKVEAVYEITPRSTAAVPTAGGPGLFYAGQIASRFNGFQYDETRSEVKASEFAGAASVYGSTGKIECGWGAIFPADVYTASGNAQIDTGCVIRGNAYVGGTVNLNGGAVEGNIVSPNTGVHRLTGIVGGSSSGGDVTVGGTIVLNAGFVRGTVTTAGAGSSTLGSGLISGNYVHRGEYSVWGAPASTTVRGSITKNASLTAPTLPTVPSWQDVDFQPVNSTTAPAAWQAKGFRLITVPAAECSRWNGTHNQDPIWPTLSSHTSPTIYDVRACGSISTNNGLTSSQRKIALNTDIAIISQGGDLVDLHFTSETPKTVWFITPDQNVAVAGPQCVAPAKKINIRSNRVGDQVALYLYSPCQVEFNSAGQWRGQVYSGELSFGGGVTMAFAPRSIPGYDFSDSTPGGSAGNGSGAGASTAVLGSIISQRNVQ